MIFFQGPCVAAHFDLSFFFLPSSPSPACRQASSSLDLSLLPSWLPVPGPPRETQAGDLLPCLACNHASYKTHRAPFTHKNNLLTLLCKIPLLGVSLSSTAASITTHSLPEQLDLLLTQLQRAYLHICILPTHSPNNFYRPFRAFYNIRLAGSSSRRIPTQHPYRLPASTQAHQHCRCIKGHSSRLYLSRRRRDCRRVSECQSNLDLTKRIKTLVARSILP